VLSDLGPEIARSGAERTAERARDRVERRGFRDVEEALDFYRQSFPEWRPAFQELHARHQLRVNWAGKLVERSDPDLYWITRGAGRSDDAYLWRCCADIQAPVLLLWGSDSPYLDEGIVGRMREAIPRFEDVIVKSDHYVPRQVPAEFCARVLEFIERP
jgi:pimeloyl-ACP methyl ester carboxylesterase